MEQKAQDKLIDNMKKGADKAKTFCEVSKIINHLEELTDLDKSAYQEIVLMGKSEYRDQLINQYVYGLNLSFGDLNRFYQNSMIRESFGERIINLMKFYAELIDKALDIKKY